jgi:endonuclease G
MRRLALACLLLWLSPARATACPEHYAGGRPPTIFKASLKPRTQELCFRAFAVMHSGVSRGPLWSAEHLVAAEVQGAEQLTRKDSFHPEPRLPAADRAELADYARSGFDRGHMAPNGDMADRASQGESFSLANIVPQHHTPNAGVWAGIEAAVRRLAEQDGEVYILTGPAFVGDRIDSLKGRVLVPTHIFKVVYSPRRQEAGAYLMTNEADTSTYSAVTVANLEELVGLRLLPGLPQHVRDNGMVLPKPTRQGGSRRKGETAPEVEYNLSDRARQAIEKVLKLFK